MERQGPDISYFLQAVSRLLPDGALALDSGLVGSIIIQLPWPNMTGDLVITISDLDVCLLLDGSRQKSTDKSLGDSLSSLAEEVMHEDTEGIELEESIQASIVGEVDPVDNGNVPVSGFIANLVEGLLARLKISVNNTCIRFRHSSKSPLEMQLRIEAIQASTTVAGPSNFVQEVVRTASIKGMNLFICGDINEASPGQDSLDDTEDSGSEADYMAMSQAIPDLRTSVIGSPSFHSTASGQESIYASAMGGEEGASRFFEAPTAPKLKRQKVSEESTEHLLFKIDGEQTVAQFIISRQSAIPKEIDDETEEEETEGKEQPSSAYARLSLGIDVNRIIGFLTPASTCALLRFSEDCLAVLRRTSDQEEAPSATRALQSNISPPTLETSIIIKEVDIVCAYERPFDLDTAHHETFKQSLQSYWIRPTKIHPEIGHLRLRLQKIDCKVLTSALESSAMLQVGDAAFYEHLSPVLTSGSPTVATTLPLILFDQHLGERDASTKNQTGQAGPSQRHNAATEDSVIESMDWRYAGPSAETSSSTHGRAGPYWRTGYGDRGWKVRPKHRRASSTATSVDEKTPIMVATVDGHSNTQIRLSPLHIFVDLSTVDRILPLLKSLGRNTRLDLASSIHSDLTASFNTLHQASVHDQSHQLQRLLTLNCDVIRIELRVPSSAPQYHLQSQAARQRRLIGLEVRAGIILVEARAVQLRLGSDETTHTKAKVHFNALGGPPRMPSDWHNQQIEIASCSVDQIAFYYKAVNDHRASSFASLGVLSSDEDSIEKPLPPRLRVLQAEQQPHITGPRLLYDCRLPVLNVSISKPLLDGLELIADDLSLWSSSLGQEPNESNSESATEALKILGSRFFGTRHSISALSGSSASVELFGRGNTIPAFSLGVHEIDIHLLVPRKQKTNVARRLRLRASELSLFIDSKNEPRSTSIDITLQSLYVDDETDSLQPLRLISRTLEPSLSRGVIPVLSVQLLSTSDADTTYRESRCEVLLQGFTVTFDGDLTLLDDIILFTRSPDGAFEHVEPNEMTRLLLRIRDVSICLAPASCQARAVVLLGDITLRTKLMPDARQTAIRGSLRDSRVLVTEKKLEEDSGIKARTSQEYWSDAGFVKLITLDEILGSLTLSNLTRPEVDVKATKVNIEITACADTMQIVETLSDHLVPPAEAGAAKGHSRSSSSSTDGAESRNLLASLDQDAFRQAKRVASLPDLLEDDLPHHPDFLKSDARWNQEEDEPTTLEGDLFDEEEEPSAVLSTKPINDIILQTDVVTVRLLDKNGIAPRSNHFTDKDLDGDDLPRQIGSSSSLRVRVHNCDITLRLHAGYDCQTTRTAVDEEAKRVRRRLQKIKQMLDQGQTPDDSVEEATASLLDSIHIPLPRGQADMEAAEMLQAMEDELGDQSETASSASTWKQFIPGRSGPVVSQRQKRKRSKLMRSKKSLIDIELRGIVLEYDSYSPKETLASRILLHSKSLQILDNIKTSTWHTFLTQMAPENLMLPRNAKEIVKIELVNVRPTPEADVEVRCRARLSPVRLHIDQDALDFLKKFAAFRSPNALPAPPKAAKMEPFIQHAEIYPIRLKLDYKPKRVDYKLLREGKTMELMNFFSFEGSEMTLRHVTIRGISGWTRFFDTLQDIWTPDVKSNQLADVLSGIAPIRSLVNVGNGVADLILLPIEQYQRDGRLGKGLKAGAKSFVKSTMLEAARIGARLATGTQVILEQAETALAGTGESSSSRSSQRQRLNDEEEEGSLNESDDEPVSRISRYADQPDNLMQALSEAQEGLSRGLNQAAQTILAVPMEVYERRSGEGGSRPVVRAVPIAVLKGAAGASGAVGKTLQGIQRELAGASLETEEDKYKKARSSSNSNSNSNSKSKDERTK
jgi:autophagy-related protein 2